ncbi:P27 family phage terminase small subunit [Paenisporosarcina macmurdoensis]|uniref:P27 family phage terminase small subunit n=1 Tax=Paenisporosarcina macmurdoensis TaxID=212659 RepID=A0ABW1L5M7_9BACL
MNARGDIRQDLIDQLEANGIYGHHYVDMIEKYMQFWDLDTKLVLVIEEEGTMLPARDGFKMNPAIKSRNENNTQMLKILTTLGLKAPATQSQGDVDGEDM